MASLGDCAPVPVTTDLGSINEDDFEVIQSNIETSYSSIGGLDSSLVLPPSLLPSSSIYSDASLASLSTLRPNGETAVLNHSMMSSSSGTSEETLNSIMRTQSELLEKTDRTLAGFSLLTDLVKGESIKSMSLQSSLVQGQLAQEREEKEQMKASLEEARDEVMAKTTEAASLTSIVQQLTQQKAQLEERLAREQGESQLKSFTISSLTARVQTLEKELATKGAQGTPVSVLPRAPSFDDTQKMMAEKEAMTQEMQRLRIALQEQYARCVEETEMKKYIQTEYDRLLQHGGVPVEHENNARVTLQLAELGEENGRLRAKVAELEALSSSTKSESEDRAAIISAMQEDQTDGTRIIADQGRRIKDLEATLSRYGADHGFP